MQHHSILLSVILLVVFVLTLAMSQPSITGYVPTKILSQSLDLTVRESQRYWLTMAKPMELTSIAISGKVKGNGLVNIYLNDGEKRKLIYTNIRRKGGSMESITGMTTSDLVLKPGERLHEKNELPKGFVTFEGSFANSCFETCVLDLPTKERLSLDVIVDEDTEVKITELSFSTA